MNIPHGIDTYPMNMVLNALLEWLGLKSMVVSYDDFNVDEGDLVKLINTNPYNRFVQGFGMAGTHDIAKGSKIMNKIINCKENEIVMVPRSEENAFVGAGKIEPITSTSQVDVLIIQSWMLGHRSVSEYDSVLTFNQGLGLINNNLRRYKEWEQLLDAILVIGTEDVTFIKSWREKLE